MQSFVGHAGGVEVEHLLKQHNIRMQLNLSLPTVSNDRDLSASTSDWSKYQTELSDWPTAALIVICCNYKIITFSIWLGSNNTMLLAAIVLLSSVKVLEFFKIKMKRTMFSKLSSLNILTFDMKSCD